MQSPLLFMYLFYPPPPSGKDRSVWGWAGDIVCAAWETMWWKRRRTPLLFSFFATMYGWNIWYLSSPSQPSCKIKKGARRGGGGVNTLSGHKVWLDNTLVERCSFFLVWWGGEIASKKILPRRFFWEEEWWVVDKGEKIPLKKCPFYSIIMVLDGVVKSLIGRRAEVFWKIHSMMGKFWFERERELGISNSCVTKSQYENEHVRTMYEHLLVLPAIL